MNCQKGKKEVSFFIGWRAAKKKKTLTKEDAETRETKVFLFIKPARDIQIKQLKAQKLANKLSVRLQPICQNMYFTGRVATLLSVPQMHL